MLVIISGCSDSTISADVAIASVREYYNTQADSWDKPYSQSEDDINNWDATYRRGGRWVVTLDSTERKYSWEYYEDSGAVNYRGCETK